MKSRNAHSFFRVFLGVVETIVGSLLCCGVGTVQCHFSLLYCVINAQNGTQTASYCNNTLQRTASK